MPTKLLKLHPPAPEILPDKPYLHDLFGRNQFGDALTSLLRNVEEGVVLCVDAKWGDGKTTFARMWMADLKRQGIRSIYFDAYEHDYADDPFVVFSAELIKLTAEGFPQQATIQNLKHEFKTAAIRMGGKMLCTTPRMAGINEHGSRAGQTGVEADASTVSGHVARALEERIAGINSHDEFRHKLSALGSAVRQEQNFPLLIIVDELDRCRPDFALSLIERIKHLFSTSNVSFVLLANTTQLESCVKLVYGADVDARNYLHKFFTLCTKLPGSYLDRGGNDRAKYCRYLIKHFGVDAHGEKMIGILVPLFDHHKFTLREMEQCFSMLSVYYSQLPNEPLSIDPVIALLVLLRVRFPLIADKLAVSKMSYKELAARLGLDAIPDSKPLADYPEFPQAGFSSLLKYLLFNTLEYESLGKEDPLRKSFQHLESAWKMERTRIIPHLCDEIVRFRMDEG